MEGKFRAVCSAEETERRDLLERCWQETRALLDRDRKSFEALFTETALQRVITFDVPADIFTCLVSHSNVNNVDSHRVTALHTAVAFERWDLVPILLQRGADVNYFNDHEDPHVPAGPTPVFLAIDNRAPAYILNQLVSPGNVNLREKHGYTALHMVVKKNRWELVPVLLQHGADVNMGSDCHETPLHLAVCHEAPADIIPQLISHQNINMLDEGGNTALHKAVRVERWELVPVLTQHGANINLSNHGNNTPLQYAVRAWAPRISALADIITLLISSQNINMRDGDGHTALYEAVIAERWELVPVLIQHGADVNLRGDWHQTPLHSAACRGAPADIITHLISPQNINMRDGGGNTALHGAVRMRRWELVPVLLRHGADVNLRGDWHQTPLHSGVYHDAPADIISQLISPHNINMEDEDGNTALHWAVKWEKWKQVPVLLQHGADPLMLNSLQPAEPMVLSLKAVCISTIRSVMPIKSDAAYEGLGLPLKLVSEVKLKPQSDYIVSIIGKQCK